MTLLLNGHGLKPAIVILALHFPATSYLHHKKIAVRYEIAGAIYFQKKEKDKKRICRMCSCKAVLGRTSPHDQDLHMPRY
jgi:hypothetical protein